MTLEYSMEQEPDHAKLEIELSGMASAESQSSSHCCSSSLVSMQVTTRGLAIVPWRWPEFQAGFTPSTVAVCI